METLGWPRNFLARCPVRLFEAAGGSSSWLPSGTAGELHMRPLGNAVLYFQLRDLLDNQILFEHTMRKPDAFIIMSQRFFVIRLENGSYRGFGFAECAAACEMKNQIQKAVKPHNLQEYSEESFTNTVTSEKRTLAKCASKRNDSSSVSFESIPKPSSTASTQLFKEERVSSVLSYEAVPKRSSTTSTKEERVSSGPLYEAVPKRSSTRSAQLFKEERVSSVPSYEAFTFSPTSKSSKWRFSWKGLTKFSYLKSMISEAFGWQEHEIEIGHPTDVKHVAHIGWDGPSVGGPSWIGELKPSPDFATGPLKEFGQPMGSDWIHDALSAAKWTTPGLGDHLGPPPGPPTEFLDPDMALAPKKRSKWKFKWLRCKSRAPSSKKPQACQL